MAVIPTRTLRQAASRLLPRQATATVTVVSAPPDGTTTSATPMSAGAIAGIVIGTILGLLLIWWIVSTCTGNNNARNQQTIAAPAVRERSRDGRRHSHSNHYYVEETRPSRSRSRRRSGSAHVVAAPARVYAAERSPRASYNGGGRSPARVYPAQAGVYDYDDYEQRPRRSSRY